MKKFLLIICAFVIATVTLVACQVEAPSDGNSPGSGTSSGSMDPNDPNHPNNDSGWTGWIPLP